MSLTLVQLRRFNQAVLMVQATPTTAQLSANLLYAVRLGVSGTRFRSVLRRHHHTRPRRAGGSELSHRTIFRTAFAHD
jgi:hypothetical protein